MSVQVITLTEPRVTLCGNAAVLLEAEGPVTLETQKRIWRVTDEVRQWSGIVDTQACINNLLIVCDPLVADTPALAERVLAAWKATPAEYPLGRLIEVAVSYGGEDGIDMRDVMDLHKLTAQELAQWHSNQEYTIFAPGTTPGYGYMMGSDTRYFTPRRQSPVMRDHNANVALGGIQCNMSAPVRPGQQPSPSPTGWWVIGRALDAPVPFDATQNPPNLVNVGDRIRFRIAKVVS